MSLDPMQEIEFEFIYICSVNLWLPAAGSSGTGPLENLRYR